MRVDEEKAAHGRLHVSDIDTKRTVALVYNITSMVILEEMVLRHYNIS